MGETGMVQVAVECEYCSGSSVWMYPCPHCGMGHAVLHLHYSTLVDEEAHRAALVRRACPGEPDMFLGLRAYLPLKNWNEQMEAEWLLGQIRPTTCPHCGQWMENREHDLFHVCHPDTGRCFLDGIRFPLKQWVAMLAHDAEVVRLATRVVPVATLRSLLETLNAAADPTVSYHGDRSELDMAKDALGFVVFQVGVALEQVYQIMGEA